MNRLIRSLVIASALFVSTAAAARESWVGLSVRVAPLYVETNKYNTANFGLGAEASWFPVKLLLVQGRYYSSVFSNGNASDYKDYYLMDASPKIKPFTYWEAGGQLNLISKSGDYENYSLHQDSATSVTGTNSTTYTTYYTKHSWMASEYHLYGIRGGIIGIESGMSAKLGKDSDTIRRANGSVVDQINRDLNYTNMTMTGYYAGVAMTRIWYQEGVWRTFFIDVLFRSKTEYKDPVLTGFTEHKIGGRAGFEGTRRHVGGRIEGGVRPGVDGFYLLAQLSLGIFL